MRILQVTHYMPPHMGGIERVAAALVQGLSNRGHELHWIAAATPEPAGDDGRSSRVAAWNGLEERIGLPYPLWSPAGLRRLDALVRWADAVHAHDCLYVGSAAAAATCRLHRKPLLITQHVGFVPYGGVLDLVQRVAYATLGRVVLGAANRRIACSRHVPRWLRERGCQSPFEVVPNGVHGERFAPAPAEVRPEQRELRGLPRDGRVLLFVGRLVPKKGVARVLAAQRQLAADGVTLVVVGDGPLAGELAGVPSVHHFPALRPEEMPQMYRLSDAFVLPSRGEGLPLSVQEAVLSGLPVIVSTDPAFTDNLQGAPGVAFAAADDDLAAVVRRQFTAAPRAADIAAWARDRWGMERFLDAYERILFELSALRTREAA